MKTIKYAGAEKNWDELSVTGKQSVWYSGWTDAREDAEADLLIATGFFTQVKPDSPEALNVRVSALEAAGPGGGGISDGDKGDVTVSGSGTVWTVDGLAAKAPLASPTFTGTPAAPTAAAATNTTQLATTAFVRTEIANLLNSAPGTLDTLDELAAALGDDPNFATTMATALALKAPLASPTFTGTVGGITKSMVGLSNVDNTSNATERAATATLTNKTLTAPTISAPVITGVTTYSGASQLSETSLGDFIAHTADGPQLTSTMAAGATLTFDATPSDGRVFGPVRVPANSGGPYTLTIPSSVNVTTGATITTVSVPASGQVELTFRRIGATNYVYGVPASAGASTALADITDMSANARTFNAAADYAAMRTALTAAARAQTGMMPIFIRTVADETLRLIINAPVALTITNITTRSGSGTCTVTGQIDGTPLGGTANAASTTEQSQAHVSANTLSAGADFLLAFSSNSACTGLAVNVHYTYTQA